LNVRAALVVFGLSLGAAALAQLAPGAGEATPIPNVNIGIKNANNPEEVASSLQILALLTVLSVAPALLVMTTAFTRIVVVFSFLRTAIGTPSIPPNQVVIGLSLFLTFYVMSPTFDKLNTESLQPYMKKEIAFDEAKDRAWGTMREFMIRQTYKKDLALFAQVGGAKLESVEDVGWQQLIPAFILSELKTAFIIGFYLFVPFLVIDLVVASTLMSMGMMMMPPAIVSLPAKVLVFLLADGWTVLVQAILGGFR
jgi:flagellar biosynthetic protein FliP